MKTIKLISMEIENFRAIPQLSVPFSSTTFIEGENGSGKTTILNAYLWCIFGKDADGKQMDVQPLDADNQPLHRITTSVTVTLSIDDTTLTIQRRQRENWSVPKGRTEEVFGGLTQERIFNDVPCSVREFDEKIRSIYDPEKWFVQTTATVFMNIDQKKRRQKLCELYHAASDIDTAQDYPEVLTALQQGKSIDELLKQTTTSRTKTRRDLDEIPARIDQANSLRPTGTDFDAIQAQQLQTEKELADLDRILTGLADPQTDDEIARLRVLRTEALDQIERLRLQATKQAEQQRSELCIQVSRLRSRLDSLTFDQKTISERLTTLREQETALSQELDDIKQLWVHYNELEYHEQLTTSCPTCGAPLPPAQLEDLRLQAFRQFEDQRIASRTKCEQQGSALSLKRKELQSRIAEETDRLLRIQSELTTLPAQITTLDRQSDQVRPDFDENSPQIEELKASALQAEERIAQLSASASDPEETTRLRSLRAEKQELLLSLTSQLAERNINEKIDLTIATLEADSRELAQTLATLDGTIFQIQAFKRKKIQLMETSISDLFTIVRWKMYEPNLTNDGEKEICQALVGGVPFEQLNTASRINAGIDIVSGLSKANQTLVPLFIDNKESVTETLPLSSQTILLKVVADQPLQIKP